MRAGPEYLSSFQQPFVGPGFDPRTIQPVASRYTNWATLALVNYNTQLLRRPTDLQLGLCPLPVHLLCFADTWLYPRFSYSHLAPTFTVVHRNVYYTSQGEIFHTRPDQPWGPPSLLYNGYIFTFPVVKRPGPGVDHPPTSTAEVKERVELYLYSPSGPSWLVLGWNYLLIPREICGFTVYLFSRKHPLCLCRDEILTYGGPSVIRFPGWSRQFWANFSTVFPIEINITVHCYYYYYYHHHHYYMLLDTVLSLEGALR